MKKIHITILFTFLAFSLIAQPIEVLETANEYYANEEYQKAISLYDSILNAGYESAALYYNLGNAHYKNGDLTNAILHYERAKLLAPKDEDIQYNLDLLNQFVIDKIETIPQPFFGHRVISTYYETRICM